MKIAVLPGDGIGTEIVAQAMRVLGVLDLHLETEEALVGGAAFEAHGHPLPESTLELAQSVDQGLGYPFPSEVLRTIEEILGQVDGHFFQRRSHSVRLGIWSKPCKDMAGRE